MAWVNYCEKKCPTHGLQSGSVYECDVCGGDGEINRYDEDPLWYGSESDGWEDCDTCDGEGSWWVCAKCATEKKESA